MRTAVEQVTPRMDGYNVFMNNCQDFIQKVIKEYNLIIKEKQ